jgi:lysozyme
MSAEALAVACRLARRWEGLRLRAYKCPAGVWTIGYGHTGPEVVEGLVWTLPQAEAALQTDMGLALSGALRQCPRLAGLPSGQCGRLGAIADFVFNLGEGRLKASTLRRKINNDEWDAVPGELRKWVWGGGKKLPGLILRREAEIALV